MIQLPTHAPYRFQAAEYDQTFLEGVKGGFDTLGIDMQLLYYLLLLFVFVGSLYLIVRFFEKIRRKLRPAPLPAHMVGKKEVIADILQQAMDRRSKFEMRFLPSEYTRPVAVCSLLDFNDKTLQFDLDSGASPTKNWIGRLVEFYFRVKGDKKQFIYYRFTSSIVEVRRLSNAVNAIVLGFPEHIELQQKRSHLRLEPPAHYLLGLAVWRESGKELPSRVKDWGRPHLRYKPDESEHTVRLDDISAGGLRMTIERKTVKENKIDVSVGQRVYIMLDLYDPEASTNRRHLLQCRVQHVYEDFESRNMEYGLQFVANGRIRKLGDEQESVLEVEWRPVDQDGVESLASWIMKRHLELYRDKGII